MMALICATPKVLLPEVFAASNLLLEDANDSKLRL